MPVISTTVALVAATAVSGAVAIASYQSQKKSAKAQAAALAESARIQKEANRVQTNQENVTNSLQRRRLAREERRRRAVLLSSAEASGAAKSSGFAGASSVIGSGFGQSAARLTERSRTAGTLSFLSQQAADANTAAGIAKMQGQLAKSRYDLIGSLALGALDLNNSLA